MARDDLHPIEISGRWYDSGAPVNVSRTATGRWRIGARSGSPTGPLLAPGLVDIQVNGHAGHDYSGAALAVADVAAVVEALAPSGTTVHVPTIITSSSERICRNLEVLVAARRSSAEVATAVPGFHVEGPFISPEDGPRGAHDRAHVRPADPAEVREWIAAADGQLLYVTLAPEVDGAIGTIEALRAAGVLVAIGHTAADAETIARAVDAGATLSTHLGNGSAAVLHRLKNHIWAQLAEDRLAAGIIADGFHVPQATLKTFLRAKQMERVFLVSDISPLAGSAPGRYRWNAIEVEVHRDGHIALAGTPYLAGAGHTLDRCVVTMMRAAAISLAEALRLATTNALAAIGLPVARPEEAVERCGLIAVREPQPDEHDLAVAGTWSQAGARLAGDHP